MVCVFSPSFNLITLITIYPCKQSAAMRFPKDFLKGLIGRPVLVKLKWGMSIQGILQSTDAFMNLQLTNAQEIVEAKPPENIGEVLIRYDLSSVFILFHYSLLLFILFSECISCNNVLYISQVNNPDEY